MRTGHSKICLSCVTSNETEILECWLQELPPEKRLLGLDLEKTDEGKALVDKGIEQGIEQGEELAEMRIAGKMIVAGKTDQEIAELPLKRIEALRKKIEIEG